MEAIIKSLRRTGKKHESTEERKSLANGEVMEGDSRSAKAANYESISEKVEDGKSMEAAADALTERLPSCDSDDELEHELICRSLRMSQKLYEDGFKPDGSIRPVLEKPSVYWKIIVLLSVATTILLFLFATLVTKNIIHVGPRNEPTGPYKLLEVQEGQDFFKFYEFFDGPDSGGSGGYINYVGRTKAAARGIYNVTYEKDDAFSNQTSLNHTLDTSTTDKKESFIYLASAPTKQGPRDSLRLEGKRIFNRGLFIIDVRHMPAGCGTWPAFWLTDKENWPVNGEIDVIEGVNTQDIAKTSLHSTKHCTMDDVPPNSRKGTWDIAQGIPDDYGHIDMTAREVTNCFVWDPHQWLNEGCVAVSDEKGTLGTPLNNKGGGVFVLEWDPINHHIRTWVFTPHLTVPDNLRQSIQTASNEDNSTRVVPDPDLWGLPFGYFPIGRGTNCPANHFQNMRMIFNLAFCGSVSGARFFLDCPVEHQKFGSDPKSCEKYIASNPPELDDAYWKIRGVYVYEREWQVHQ